MVEDMGKMKDISSWVRANVAKILSNRKYTVMSILCVLIVGHALFILTVQMDWTVRTLNDEMGSESLPTFEEGNTTMKIEPVEASYPNDPADSEIVTSEYGAEIEVRYIPWPINLNICYMEVLVFNGTPCVDLDGWSLNITDGNQSGEYKFSPASVVIPIHEPKTEITFQIRLLSTDFNKTYPTPTSLNGMNFTYTVYYETSVITADYNERILVDANSKLIWFLTFLMIASLYALPERESVRYDKHETITLTTTNDASTMIDFLSGRIDNVDRDRHYLAIETQILVVILGTIASYTINSEIGQYFAVAIVILAFPLVLSVIALVAGNRSDSSDHIYSLDSTQIVYHLKTELLRKERFMGRVKTLIFGGSLYAIEVVLLLTFPPIAEYQYYAVLVTKGTITMLLLALLVLVSFNVYRRLIRLDEFFYENSEGEE